VGKWKFPTFSYSKVSIVEIESKARWDKTMKYLVQNNVPHAK
jgi:hypothetical protein